MARRRWFGCRPRWSPRLGQCRPRTAPWTPPCPFPSSRSSSSASRSSRRRGCCRLRYRLSVPRPHCWLPRLSAQLGRRVRILEREENLNIVCQSPSPLWPPKVRPSRFISVMVLVRQLTVSKVSPEEPRQTPVTLRPSRFSLKMWLRKSKFLERTFILLLPVSTTYRLSSPEGEKVFVLNQIIALATVSLTVQY